VGPLEENLSKIEVKERRSHPRQVAELDIQGTPHGGGTVARMVTRDLSLGGLYCTSTTDFPEMTRLAVRLLLPTDESAEPAPLDIQAVVVRRQQLPAINGHPRYDLALFFTHLTSQTRERLRYFLGVETSA
jgi:hypothetical protein